jgi:hypothetical protein
MYRSLTHQVSPEANALQCTDCHAEEGKIKFKAPGHTPAKAALVMTFPPVEPTPEPTIVPTEDPTEEPTGEPEAVEETLEDTPPDVATDIQPHKESNTLTWVLTGGGAVIVAVVSHFLTQRNN